MYTLVISILALFVAVPLYEIFRRNHGLYRLLNGFIFVAVGGLVVAVIMPSVIEAAGWWTLVALVAGIYLPSLSERVFRESAKRVHFVALLLGVLAFALHVVSDGAALAGGHDHSHDHDTRHALAIGIALHRIPIGLGIWWFVRPHYGVAAALALLMCVGVGTIVGYVWAPAALDLLSSEGMAMFQAFVAGTLLHVVLHGIKSTSETDETLNVKAWWEGLGNLFGVALVAYLLWSHPITTSPWLMEFYDGLTTLILESAPALVIAYLAAAIFATFLPGSYVRWMSRGSPLQQSLRGVAVGLPIPVCSCGVVPLYHALIRKGVPPTAAMAFLVATPELGIDAILLSLPLLGGTMTVARVVAAAIVALLIGLLIGRLIEPQQQPSETVKTDRGSLSDSLSRVRHSMNEIVDHTAPWIVAGILVAAAINPTLQDGGLHWIPAGLEVPFFALLGLPMYVCASGATPLVAIFLMGGVSPGAALAFLLTGPATNITTFGVLKRLHGQRVAILFGAMAFGITVTLGYLANLALPNFEPLFLGKEHQEWDLINTISVLLLCMLLLDAILRRGARAFIRELNAGGESENHVHADAH